ncbi:hypothetical protein [Rubrivirga sp.]|uniref:hypothetical protein n=1 Tax=Rubrivirga sp. TaxID=1885344 RepID=UPI003C7545C2
MNVRSSLDSLAKPVAKVDSSTSRGPNPSRTSSTPSAPAGTDADRVELSAAALAQPLAPPAADAASDLEIARTALRLGADLSVRELHELREKVRTGHYDQADVLDRVANAAARDLGVE